MMVAAGMMAMGDVNTSSVIVSLCLSFGHGHSVSRDHRGVSLGPGHKLLHLLIQLLPVPAPPCLLLHPPAASSLTAVAARPRSK